MTVAVVGGGIGGLTLAVALRRRGFARHASAEHERVPSWKARTVADRRMRGLLPGAVAFGDAVLDAIRARAVTRPRSVRRVVRTMPARGRGPIVCPMTPLLAPTRAAPRIAPRTAPAPVPPPRRIHNPVQRDSVTFVETCDETGGLRTVVDLAVSPGGGNVLHTHRSYDERFAVLAGSLGVQVGRRVTVLGPGESAVAPAGAPHRWFNPGTRPARVLVTLTSGHAGFERALRVAYGLARDGLVDGRGVPRSLAHVALLLELSDTEPTGAGRLLAPALRALARRARADGVERALVERYCGAW